MNLYQLNAGFKLFFVFSALFSSSLIVGCKKSVKSVPSSNVDVYIAGTVFSGKMTIATLWKNGVSTPLADSTNISYANAITVVNGDVYVAGSLNGNAVYWKNGVVHNLVIASEGSNATAIAVIGGNVWVVGNTSNLGDYYTIPVYWENDVMQYLAVDPLNNFFPTGIAIDGNNLFVSGYGTDEKPDMNTEVVYWKNQTLYYLDSLSKYSNGADAVAVNNGDVYIAGTSLDTSNLSKYFLRALIWKNGVRTVLDNIDEDSEPTAITISGSDVYIAGELNDKSACYWKNGSLNVIATGTAILPCAANAIAVSGSDVYITGRSGRAVGYWKNGSLTELAPIGLGSGISVVPHVK